MKDSASKMTESDRPPESRRANAPYRTLRSGTYFGAVIGLACALALSGLWLPPLVVAVVAGVLMLGMGVLVWRRQRVVRIMADPRWRDVMPCYLSVQDRDLRILETNQLFRQDFGAGIGQRCYRIYKDRETPCPDCPVLKTFADGENHRREETVVTNAGEVADVIVTSAPLRNRKGETVAVVEMSTNITQSKQLHDELDRSRRHFKRLFDVVPCYISVQNSNYQVVESNQLFKEDFDWAEGKHCYRLYKGRDSVCPNCPVEKTFADGKVHSSEEQVITKDGRQADMIVYSMPVHDVHGEISAGREVSTDISEVKRLQHELAMVGLAVAGMTHRMKNILTGLEGGIFVVDTGFEMDDQTMVDEGWQMVTRNIAKVSQIAKDLLYCAKEREPKWLDDVSPQAILKDVHELYHARAATEGIELELDLDDPPQTGRFDPEALHSLVLNLTSNAVDACRFDPDTAKQHRIILRCRFKPSGATVIEVEDNGAGIPKEESHKVFQAFFSVKGTEGTGIGLLVVQRVAEAHDAALSFSTEEGVGTTFQVEFPPADKRRDSTV